MNLKMISFCFIPPCLATKFYFNIWELVHWTTMTTLMWHTAWMIQGQDHKILLNVKFITAQELWLLSSEIDGKPTNANLYFKLSSSTCFPVVSFWLSSCSSNAFILKLKKKKIRKAMKKMVQTKSSLQLAIWASWS